MSQKNAKKLALNINDFFEYKIERMIKNTNFAAEKKWFIFRKSLLAVFNDWKQKLISNESSLTESDSLYPESINNTKDKIKERCKTCF